MKNLRFLDTGQKNSYTQMATDEAVLKSVIDGNSKQTLRFYRWTKPAVALGYFQSVEDEVNVKRCREDGVEIFRRMTGGGAVYKDPKGELNYSLVIDEDHPKIPDDIESSYRFINSCVVNGLGKLGVEAEHSGINDVTIDGRKVSGNAQTRKKGVILHHGTVLLDFEVEKMVKYLNISKEKSTDKSTEEIEDRILSLKDKRPKIGMEELKDVLIEGFTQGLDCKSSEEKMAEREKIEMKDLKRKKYSTRDWNFMR